MFLGHFAVGLASKRLAPRVSLGWLVLAPAFADLLWPVFVLLGLERVRIDPGNTAVTPLDFVSYPWSHSLLLGLWWGAILAGAYWLKGNDGRGAAVIGAGVVSHWVFDFFVHRPDLPLAPGVARKVGLGLWRSLPLTLLVELGLLAAAVFLYAKGTRPSDRIGRWGLVGFVAILVSIYLAAVLGPPPPSVPALAGGALVGVGFVPFAHWFDKHRSSLARE